MLVRLHCNINQDCHILADNRLIMITFFMITYDTHSMCARRLQKLIYLHFWQTVSCSAVCSAASSYAAMRMVAGSRSVFVIAWEWHIGLALLCGCLGEYPTTNSWRPINKSLSLSLSLWRFLSNRRNKSK